jgi:phage baseplate assembly protein V
MQNFAELLRLINNLIRLGTVAEVDPAAVRCRIKIGDLETNWIRWVSARAGTTRDWDPPTVGEQVVVFAPGGDLSAAFFITGLNQTAHPAPSDNPKLWKRIFPDDTEITYDHENHKLDISVPTEGQINIFVNGHCSVDAKTMDLGRPDALQKSVLGDNMAAAMVELIQKINSSQVIGNLGAPTSAIQAVTAVEVPNLVSGGNSYSEKNRNQ